MKSRKITKTLSVISGLLVGLIAITTLLYFGLNRIKEPEIPVEVEPEPPACEVRDHVKVYLAIDEYYTLDDVGYTSENDGVAMVMNNRVKGISVGKTTLVNDCNSYEIEVTDMITAPYASTEKQFLPCEQYTQEENDYLDEVLKAKVAEKGYKTRAGAVEAARFLLLQFPYKLDYFSENGRLYGAADLCEGEGRFYHEGLYLHVYKAELFVPGSIIHGPVPWGCMMYSIPAECNQPNSLDCSGFVTWALVNGGFDPGDLGAGPDDNNPDYTDLGENHYISEESLDHVKVGDLFSAPGHDAHVGILIGKKDGIYYIAESNLEIDVRVRKATKEDLCNTDFERWIDMDNFYKQDGKLTDYWE